MRFVSTTTLTRALGANWRVGRRRDLSWVVTRSCASGSGSANHGTVTVEPVSIIDAGDRVVVRQIAHVEGRGPALHQEFTTVSTFRNGRIFLIDYFWDYAEALKAVGLEE